MNYDQTLSYIMRQLPMYQRTGIAAYRTGLDNTLKLDEYFRQPHRHFKTVHVAGTNGKGSVSHMIASILQEAGYKTGLYTSPHLVDFRERIRINGTMIPKSFVAKFINAHKSFFETFDPSFFEISVYMAFEYFKENHADLAVIEVGLGGRLDATNIITPALSVITNIGLDHTEILGDTIPKIAVEKAGIIKRNIPVVIGETQDVTANVFNDIASKMAAPITYADNHYKIDYSLMSVDGCQVFNVRKNDEVRYPNLKCGLLGTYQKKNVVTVLCAIEKLASLDEANPLLLKDSHIYSGIKKVVTNTGLAGRWQVVRHKPQVVCDTAHNYEGIKVVLQQIRETAHNKLHMVLGFVNDKDLTEVMKILPLNADYYFVRLSVPRTMDEKDLALTAATKGIRGKSYTGIDFAYNDVLTKAKENDLVVITGSNFLVADFFITNLI